jgi:hypothetical protein
LPSSKLVQFEFYAAATVFGSDYKQGNIANAQYGRVFDSALAFQLSRVQPYVPSLHYPSSNYSEETTDGIAIQGRRRSADTRISRHLDILTIRESLRLVRDDNMPRRRSRKPVRVPLSAHGQSLQGRAQSCSLFPRAGLNAVMPETALN